MTRIASPLFLYLAWLIALFGLAISYFVEWGIGSVPCPLCWYQRLPLISLAILFGVALYRREYFLFPYYVPFLAIGFFAKAA